MNDFSVEFVDFILTPNDKSIGIATVKLYGKLFMRYKILPNKDASGFFSSPSSFKVNKDGVEAFLPSFMIDSRSEENTIKALIHDSVKRLLPSAKEEAPF